MDVIHSVLQKTQDEPYYTSFCQLICSYVGLVNQSYLQKLISNCNSCHNYRIIGLILGAHPDAIGSVEKWILATIDETSIVAAPSSIEYHDMICDMFSLYASLCLHHSGQMLVGKSLLREIIHAYLNYYQLRSTRKQRFRMD